MKMLVDTGSSKTILSQKQYMRLRESVDPLESTDTTLVSASGEPIRVRGTTSTTIRIGTHTIFTEIIVADIEQQGILGLDVMEELDCSIQIKAGTMTIKHDKITMQRGQEDKCCRVRVAQTVRIPAHSEKKFYVFADSKEQKGIRMIEPARSFIERNGLLVSHNLVNGNKRMVTSGLNVSPKDIVIQKGTPLGLLCPVEEVFSDDPSVESPNETKLPSELEPLVGEAKDLSRSQKETASTLLTEYQDIFVGSDGKLGQTSVTKHRIDTGESRPIKQPVRRLPWAQTEIADKEVEKMLAQGTIEPSSSPWASPIVLVTKKDGSTRFCVDYRKLNSITKKDAYPLPNIQEAIDTLHGSHWFSTLDLASGYWQVEMDEHDKAKTAFSTRKGLYQFNVMPFGLCNAPATFERLMESVLCGLNWETCLVYIDDIIVFGRTFEESLENLRKVFDRLRQANLKLKPKKCNLFQRKVKYLGHVVSGEGVQCDPEKIDKVLNWPGPKRVKDVRSFLGFASYYRKFIPDFSTIAAPLTALTKKVTRKNGFHWNPSAEAAFQKLKIALTSTPILAYPSRNDRFILDTDASGVGMGGVLSQLQDGEERVVAYASKTFNKAQQQYCTTRRELLAMVEMISHFRHYLWGRNFLLRTDHASLKWLINFKKPEGILARWLAALSTYDFEIEHRPGNKHQNADGLSRQCRYCKKDRCCDLNSEVIHAIDSASSESDDPNWMGSWSVDHLRNEQTKDPAIHKIRDLLEKDPPIRPKWSEVEGESPDFKALWIQWSKLKVQHNVLYRQIQLESQVAVTTQLVLPKNLRKEVLNELHNKRTAGHLGIKRTADRVRQRFYWPGFRVDVKRWCKLCLDCEARKPRVGPRHAPLKQFQAGAPLEKIGMDILGPIPETERGNKYILVISDYFSKWTAAYALPDQTAFTVAEAFLQNFVALFGAPKQLHTDQGRDFESRLFKQLCTTLGIEKTRTSPYHPRSDGLVERFNKTVANMLSAYSNENQDNWDDHLPYVMMAYRASVHESTKCTPNLLFLSREIYLPVDLMYGVSSTMRDLEYCPSNYVEWLRDVTMYAHEFARKNLKKAAIRQKKYFDRTSSDREFPVGSWVWWWFPPKGKQKFGRGWTGPYLIIRKMSEITYEIQRQPTSRSRVVHVDSLKKYESWEMPRSWLTVPQRNVLDETENVSDISSSRSEHDSMEDSPVQRDLSTHDIPLTQRSIADDIASPVPRTTRPRRKIRPPQRYSPS